MFKKILTLLLLLAVTLPHITHGQARNPADSLTSLLRAAKTDTTRARLYLQLMMTAVDTDSTLAVKYASSGIAMANKGKAPAMVADIQNQLGTFYNYRGNRAKSDSLINASLGIRLSIKDSLGAAKSLMNLGHNNYDQNDFVKALGFYTRAARIRQQKNDSSGLAGSYIWMGNVYRAGMANYKAAFDMYNKALSIYLKQHDEVGEGYCYGNIATVYNDQKAFDKALIYYLKALKIREKANNPRGLADLYNNIGNMYFESHKLDEALSYYNRSLEIRKQLGNRMGVATSLLNIGNTYFFKNDLPMARKLLLQAEKESKEIGFKVGMRDSYQTLYELERQQKHYPEAIHYLLMQDNYKDSILNENSARQMAEIQTRYETEKKEQQITLLNKQTLIQQLQIRGRNTTIIIICSLFLIAGVLGYLFYNRYRLKQKAVLQAEVIRQQDLATQGIISAEENERRRIAGDLHDGVGQLLSATRLNLDTLLERIKITNPENQELATKTMAMVDEGCREVRTIAHQMMPNVLLKMGLVSALRDFVNKIDSRRLKIVLEAVGLENRLSDNVEIVLYRVIQETVNNVIKHAQATLLDIQLIMEDNEVSVTIEDNGRGFDSSDRSKFEGIGLKNIITRVEYLKGTVDISSSVGKGTLVAILIPL